ncbi:MAG: hypothetical protein ACR2NN_24870 [Bryobacteraceae bacterium]
MKSSWCIVWILGALLVIATLDNLPDPPAANPATAQFKASCLHEYSVATAAQCCESLGASFRFPIRFVAADRFEPHRRSDRMVLTVQAADPSPPALQS